MIKQIRNLLLLMLLTGTFAISCNKGDSSIEQKSPVIESQHSAPTSARVIENIRNVPIDAVFFNECCSENVHVFGIAHFVVTDNIIHVQVSNMTGTGLLTNYTYTGLGPSVETNVFYSSQFEGTLTFMLHMANDNGCGFRLKATLHITMNGNGDITANIERIETRCN